MRSSSEVDFLLSGFQQREVVGSPVYFDGEAGRLSVDKFPANSSTPNGISSIVYESSGFNQGGLVQVSCLVIWWKEGGWRRQVQRSVSSPAFPGELN